MDDPITMRPHYKECALINLPCVALSPFSLDGEAHPVSSRLGSPVPVAMFLTRGLKGFRDG